MGRRNTLLPRGLSRVDHNASNVHLWRVQNEDGSFLYFGDASHGGKEQALEVALKALLKLPVIGIHHNRSTKNTTGIIGVAPIQHKGVLVAFKASAGSPKSHYYSEVFSIALWGEKFARLMAIDAREEFVAKIESRELKKRNREIRRLLKKLEKEKR